LGFSTVACFLLQEAAARVSIISGLNLGQAIAKSFDGSVAKVPILILVIGAIILGSAAYQTGNILGAVVGLELMFDLPHQIMVSIVGVLVIIVLSLPSLRIVARFMGFLVVFMGLVFLTTAVFVADSLPSSDILTGLFVPSFPQENGANLLILGLIGTTVVPYNLFLGSGVSDKTHELKDMRFGLFVAIVLGCLISMAVLVVGTTITGKFSFQALAQALTAQLGGWAVYLFGFGMFAAGFSSAITAPLASSITAQSLFGSQNEKKWSHTSRNYRIIWMIVLVTGLVFGFSKVQPVPAIILAQALNGLVLPFISIFLVFVINNPTLMRDGTLNKHWNNVLMGLVVWVSLNLGLFNVLKAVYKTLGWGASFDTYWWVIIALASSLISIWVWVEAYKLRKHLPHKQ
jgi:Mn2+/Fe2+ NRAMP family transporter